ncbi:hypothetical protein ACX3YG_11065 [Pseudomonas wadenswilerensis]
MTKQTSDELGLELSEYGLYPPLTSARARRVYITTQADNDPTIELTYTVNGESGKFKGLALWTDSNGNRISIDEAFIHNYPGTWPVAVVVTATLGEVQESATLMLYDTRSMAAARAEVVLTPSAVVQIPPAGGTAWAVVNSTFRDSADIELPYDEITWQATLNPPVAGVVLVGVKIEVSSMPHADKVEVRVTGPNGVTGNATLTLVK